MQKRWILVGNTGTWMSVHGGNHGNQCHGKTLQNWVIVLFKLWFVVTEGTNCESDRRQCETQPCQNQGECQEGPNGFQWVKTKCTFLWLSLFLSFRELQKISPWICRCFCLEGFDGRLCENDRRGCSSFPCLNNGGCIPLPNNAYRCQCASGFQGQFCEFNIDECVQNNCQHFSQCIDGIGTSTVSLVRPLLQIEFTAATIYLTSRACWHCRILQLCLFAGIHRRVLWARSGFLL